MRHLHVLKDGVVRAIFALDGRMHRLGSGMDADLMVAQAVAPRLLCRLDVNPAGTVSVRSLDVEAHGLVHRLNGEAAESLPLANGEPVELAGIRLLLLSIPEAVDLRVQEPVASGQETEPSPEVAAPVHAEVALLIKLPKGTQTVRVGKALEVRIGRDADNTVQLRHAAVSRHHARLVRRVNGWWLQDLASTRGTRVDGEWVRDGHLRMGALMQFSESEAAPSIVIVPLADALNNPAEDELTAGLRGHSEPMRQLRVQIAKHATLSTFPVLLLGETGTGKELAARALAQGRPGGLFVVQSCANLPDDIVESLLFGHIKGAFTGADKDQEGLILRANGGTLFLDEIGELPLHLQAKLLRVLEERAVLRLGEHQPRKVDFRLVCATHRDLAAMVAQGSFRQDLLYRIQGVTIRLPALRDHKDDLEQLARHFLGGLTPPLSGRFLSEAALAKLSAYDWPGNVRQLRHVLERAVVETEARELGPESIELEAPPVSAVPAETLKSIDNLPAYLEDLERAFCVKALAEHGEIKAAAKALGMSRYRLMRRMESWGIQA